MATVRIAAQPNPTSTIKAQLVQALAQDRTIVSGADTYLAIASPTQAQVAAQVRALTQAVRMLALQNIGMARLLSNTLDGTT